MDAYRRRHKTPAQRGVEACACWLEGELAQIWPKIVAALGATALRALLHEPKARLKEYMEQKQAAHVAGLMVVATWHPSYVLRAPSAGARERACAQMVAALRRAHALAGEC
ncbi:hypothetical protein E1N52_35705 [Paraburkholderia guartelaensis]|uniref:Uracil-DNA glycosylase-like domain-containing protein n=1 Tax=Paraburkholderia guartelaensis TaxID=2546446 RepID=A0A4R5L631_9BURK|nr:uracil-DNA glycosylase family protein [Paraburkholderia guartelaensis]TDG03234.1 hypothetical protein E1N52_35705 [Paraburkholderia guartelaensis]